jgi:methyl halide transferase
VSGTQAIDWEGRYRTGSLGWERPGLNPAFLAWRESGDLAPCRIMVPGGGRSVEPVAMAEAGFEVTVVDGAPSAVAAQRARMERLHVPGHVEQADLFSWNPKAPFDAIYDQTCLCALPPAKWPEYAARLHHWLVPAGRLFILFMQTSVAGGPPFHCDMDDMRLLFPETQWDWPDVLPPVVAHSPGRIEQPAVLRSR